MAWGRFGSSEVPTCSESPLEAPTGGLYLDPRLESGGMLGPTGDWFRGSWRVARLRPCAVVDGVAQDGVALDRTPDSWDVQETSSYVADLVAKSAH